MHTDFLCFSGSNFCWNIDEYLLALLGTVLCIHLASGGIGPCMGMALLQLQIEHRCKQGDDPGFLWIQPRSCCLGSDHVLCIPPESRLWHSMLLSAIPPLSAAGKHIFNIQYIESRC